jgi:hypothetical protein
MSSAANSRIALGTAQFGLPYGIANRAGQVGRDEAAAILVHARSMGVDTLDTAIAYGESEQRLGDIGVARWRVVSKLPPIPECCADVDSWVRDSVRGSLERLGIATLHGLLLHHSHQLLGDRGHVLYRALYALKDRGMVEKIGVSIYGPDELDALWPHFPLDLVQTPLNIMDRRIARSGWLMRLHEAGTEVHVRSAFLQGLLLMNDDDRPEKFKAWQPLWSKWHRWLEDEALTPLQACLGFVLSQPEIDRVVVGVDSLTQLQEILASVEDRAVVPPIPLMSSDPDLINPSRWNVP